MNLQKSLKKIKKNSVFFAKTREEYVNSVYSESRQEHDDADAWVAYEEAKMYYPVVNRSDSARRSQGVLSSCKYMKDARSLKLWSGEYCESAYLWALAVTADLSSPIRA